MVTYKHFVVLRNIYYKYPLPSVAPISICMCIADTIPNLGGWRRIAGDGSPQDINIQVIYVYHIYVDISVYNN
jgi:hypothetical protein